jgi:molecular chaperone HtpG
MNQMIAALSERRQAELNRIRSRIDDVDMRLLNHGETVALRQSADLSLEALETWLLDAEQKQLLQLNPWDVFFLYASCLLCDIGLTKLVPQSPDVHAKSADASPSASLYESSRHFILEEWMALGIRDASVAAVVADVCGGMDPYNLAKADYCASEHHFDGVAINRPLLSAAAGLAKALDLGAPATAAVVCNHLSSSADITWEQYQGSFSVTGAGPHPYLSGTIQMKIQCRNPDIHRALKHHERGIQRQLQHINRHVSPRFIYSDVLFEIEAQGYAPVDLKFSVDTSAALKLLTGNRLYSDNRVFLRELLQNAVDACNLRKRLEPSYEPSIHIRFNKDISKVTVRDNGIGMDRQWIEKYFLTIGISLYQSSEVRSARQRSHIDFSFISQFGIGFLSSFLVAEKIIIKTRKSDGSGMRITITNLRDYFDVRDLDDAFAPGTEVTLHLKPSKIN